MIESAVREFVRQRANRRCEYCRLPQAYVPVVRFHIEHLTAKQHGGGDAPSNLALACPHCNSYKGPNLTAVDPESKQIVPLFHPRKDVWQDHFHLRGVEIAGLTATGRATVHLLNMNAEERLKVR